MSNELTSPADGPRVPGFDSTVSQPARRYNYLLGGKDNFQADREAAEALIKAYPGARTAAVENRRFMERAVRFLAGECGIRQFLDIGAALPVEPNVHEIAQKIDPSCRVVYVDNDPLVGVHGRALFTSTPQGRTVFVEGDLRSPDSFLNAEQTRDVLDFSQPIGVLIVAVLHFVREDEQPYRAVHDVMRRVPIGSYLAVTHGTIDPIPADLLPRVQALIEDPANGALVPRTRAQVEAFAAGLELVEPGVVATSLWRPKPGSSPPTPAEVATDALVARKTKGVAG